MGDVDEAGEAHMEVLVELPPAQSVIQVLHCAVERHRLPKKRESIWSGLLKDYCVI